MENFLGKADNQGARDMALLFLADLRSNGGWNVTEMCLHAHSHHGFNFEFVWEGGSLVAIKFIRGE